jgi:peptidoglycan/xylan/chitin deacetylase (PgdA/CDA1 family)
MQALRIDRVLTMAVFQPFHRAGFSAHGARLPILMYHSLSDDPENGVAAYYKTNTDPLIFRQQMRQLAREGYKTIDLTRAVELLADGRLPAEKSVVITFDDGFDNFRTRAFPTLQEYGFTAAVFLPTAFIGTARRSFKGTECMTWNEVRELRKAGITFGSHTVNHPELIELPFQEIQRELRDSKIELEQQLGEPVTTFAYPYAFPRGTRRFAQSFKELLVHSGYACCVTTELGRVRPGDDPYRLKRLPANSLDDPALFRAKLEGGYDWLAAPQAFIKKLKSQIRGSKERHSAAANRTPRPQLNSRT